MRTDVFNRSEIIKAHIRKATPIIIAETCMISRFWNCINKTRKNKGWRFSWNRAEASWPQKVELFAQWK